MVINNQIIWTFEIKQSDHLYRWSPTFREGENRNPQRSKSFIFGPRVANWSEFFYRLGRRGLDVSWAAVLKIKPHFLDYFLVSSMGSDKFTDQPNPLTIPTHSPSRCPQLPPHHCPPAISSNHLPSPSPLPPFSFFSFSLLLLISYPSSW